ncbi:MAG: hypothetical protein ACSLE5_12760 [Porticoccaceae bacterium]
MQKVLSTLLVGLLLIGVVLPAAADRDKHHRSQFTHREHYRVDRNYYPERHGRHHSYYREDRHYRVDHHYYHEDQHHYRPHYHERVVVYREPADDYYKWIGGAILLGEVLHHRSD